MICPCHDVTRADIERAVESGHTSPETVKRATAVYMGACQGKFCAPLVQSLLIELGVETETEQRRPAARLPIEPIALGMFSDDLAPAQQPTTPAPHPATPDQQPPTPEQGPDPRKVDTVG